MAENNQLPNSNDVKASTGDLNNKDAILDILNAGDDDEESKPLDIGDKEDDDDKEDSTDDKDEDKEKEDKEDSDDEEDKDDTDEKDKLEEDDEDKDVDALITPVSVKELKAAYPEIFKKFPFFENVIFREKAFTEVFPTVQDAKDAVETLDAYQHVEREVFSGTTENILKQVKENNPDAFAKIVNEYLPTLAKVDQNAFGHLLGNINKQFVKNMHKHGNDIGGEKGENFKNAALVLFDFMFPGQQYTSPVAYGNPENQQGVKKDDISEERRAFQQERFNAVGTDLQTGIQKQLRATIDNNIDRKGVMTPFIKKTAIAEVEQNLEKVLSTDRRFSAHMGNLWKDAERKNYNRESMNLIRSTYLGKAKTILGGVIQNVRNEALKGLGKAKNNDQDRRGPITPGRSASQSKVSRNDGSGNKQTNKGDKQPNESVQDYFMRD